MTAPASTAPRKRGNWAKTGLWTLLVIFVLLIGLSLWLTVAGDPDDQFRISPETTVLTGPLTEDGLVDYAAAIRQRNRDEVPPEQNAARLLLEAIGPQAFNSEEEARQAYEQLGMEPLPESSDRQYLISLQEMLAKESGETPQDRERRQLITGDQLFHCMSVPWSPHDAPEIADWIAANSLALEKAHAASLLPCFRSPVIDAPDGIFIAVGLPTIEHSREFLRLLMARAMQRLDAGDPAGAWDDIHCAHRLACLQSHGDFEHEFLVACALSSIASAAIPALLESPRMTPNLLQTIREDFNRLGEWRDYSEILDTSMRYGILDVIQNCTRQGPYVINALHGLWGDDLELPEHVLMNRGLNAVIDWDAILLEANDVCDQIVAAFQETDPHRRAALVEQVDDRRFEFRREVTGNSFPWIDPTWHIGGTVLAYLWPSMQGAHEMMLRRDARFALIDTAFAIEQFRFDHGRIPGSLAELVPDYVDALPLDPCTTADELRYVVHPGDAYVLYSVGNDGVDDGGTSSRDDVIFEVRMPTPEMPRFEGAAASGSPAPDPG